MNDRSISLSMATSLDAASNNSFVEPARKVVAPFDLNRQRASAPHQLARDTRWAELTADGEAMHELRAQLQLRWFNNGQHQVLAIAGVDARVARPSVTARLACAFFAVGSRTLVIDADLRHPSLHTFFDVNEGPGLSGILNGDCSLDAAVQSGPGDSLSILPAGPALEHPERLLSRVRLESLLDEAQREFDIILVEAPTHAANADAAVICSAVGGVLVTVRRHRTHARSLRRLAADLKVLSVPVVGALFADA